MKLKFCLAVLCFLLGCVNEVKIPNDVMSKSEMISFLIDVHVLEAQTSQLRIPRDSSLIVFKYFERELMEQYGIKDSSYYRSLEFYYSNPVLMEEIYAAVLDSLSLYERMSKGNLEGKEGEQSNN